MESILNASTRQQAALWYAQQRLPVFAIRAGSKVPLPGTHGCKDATCDEAAVERTVFGERNVAIATGDVSSHAGIPLAGYRRVIVIDDDAYKNADGIDYIAKWQQETGRTLPPTICQRTAHGGYQFFYDDPEGRIRKGGARESVHIDIRADGGYVVVAPSVLQDGGQYSWVYPPDTHAMGKVDDNVMAFYQWWDAQAGTSDVQSRKRTDRRGNVGPREFNEGHVPFRFPDGGVQEGGRNCSMHSFLGYLRSRGLEEECIQAMANIANDALFSPELGDWELGRIIGNIMRFEAGSAKWMDGDTAEVIRQFAFAMFRKNVPAGVVFDLAMAFGAFNIRPDISEEEVAEVINGMLRSWGIDGKVGGD